MILWFFIRFGAGEHLHCVTEVSDLGCICAGSVSRCRACLPEHPSVPDPCSAPGRLSRNELCVWWAAPGDPAPPPSLLQDRGLQLGKPHAAWEAGRGAAGGSSPGGLGHVDRVCGVPGGEGSWARPFGAPWCGASRFRASMAKPAVSHALSGSALGLVPQGRHRRRCC